MKWVQDKIGAGNFGGYPPFKKEEIAYGNYIIVDSRGMNALGFSKISNKRRWIPIQETLDYVITILNKE